MRSLVLYCCSCSLVPALDVLLAPPVFNPSNYERVPIGHYGAFEGGAYVARVDGAEAGWYNPAGLPHADQHNISANGSFFVFTDVEISAGGETQGTNTFDQVPIYVGSSSRLTDGDGRRGWYLGLTAASPNSWSQSFSANPTFETTQGSIDFTNLVTYDTRTTSRGIVPGISLAFDSGRNWRIGGAIEGGYNTFNTRINFGQYVRNDDLTITGSHLAASEFDVTVIGVRAVIAGQYQLGERWAFGAKVATPYASMHEDALISYQLIQDVNAFFPLGPGEAEHTELIFRDDSPGITVKTPWEIHLGAAYLADRWQLEVDCRYYTAIGSYQAFQTDQEISVLRVVGGVASESTTPFVGDGEAAEAVLNVAIGGHYAVSPGVAVHGGFHTDYTPGRSDDDTIEVDLFHLTGGVSFRREHIVTSIGLSLTVGEESVDRTDTIVGAVDDAAKVSYSSVGFLLATTFVF